MVRIYVCISWWQSRSSLLCVPVFSCKCILPNILLLTVALNKYTCPAFMQVYTRLNLTPFPDPSYFHIGDFLSQAQTFYLRFLSRLLFQGLDHFFPLKFYKPCSSLARSTGLLWVQLLMASFNELQFPCSEMVSSHPDLCAIPNLDVIPSNFAFEHWWVVRSPSFNTQS